MSMRWSIDHGDCREVLRDVADNSLDACVTDPPYELGFMGKNWDASGIAYSVDLWREILRVLKPGSHLLAFGGARTYHRMTCAIEDAGFEVRDSLHWLYSSGFPKSMDIDKAIRAMAGIDADNGKVSASDNPDVKRRALAAAESGDFGGWGTALKPAHEPIVLARKPVIGSITENVVTLRTGALNVGGCRVGNEKRYSAPASTNRVTTMGRPDHSGSGWRAGYEGKEVTGRHPANVIVDEDIANENDWSSYFYVSKAGKKERTGNPHPAVKPVELMRYLVRMVTPKGGVVLDPFCGSGSTGVAALQEGFVFVGIEKEPEYVLVANQRLKEAA